VLAKNSLEYFLLYGAASALGLIVLAINWRLSGDEVENNLKDGGPKFIFADPEFQELINGLRDKLTSVEKYYNLGGEGGSFEDLGQLLDNKADFKPPDVSSEDGFVIIHTAGGAGNPRGALLSNGNIISASTQFSYI